MTLRDHEKSPIYRSRKDDIQELQSGGKYASEDDFEESMYIQTLLNA